MLNIALIDNGSDFVARWQDLLSPHFNINVMSCKYNTARPVENCWLAILDAVMTSQQDIDLEKLFPVSTKYMVVGNQCADKDKQRFIINGAAGYCESTETEKTLLKAIDSIYRGEIWIQRELVSTIISELVQNSLSNTGEQTNIPVERKLENLSARESIIVKKVLTGVSNKTIADSLFITERTVKAHLTSIFKKLQIPNRLHLAILLSGKRQWLVQG